MSRSRSFAALSCLGLLVGGAGPAGGAPPFVDRLDVEVVNVEVLVTDREGSPIPGLTRSDFRVTENGEPVEVTHFAAFGATAGPSSAGARPRPPSPGPAAAGEIAPPLHVVIFLDEVHVGPGGRRQAMATLAEELSARLREDDEVMVAAYDGRTRILLPFSTDRRALHRALTDLSGLSTARLLVEQERRFALELAREDAGSQPGCLYMESIIRNHAEQELARVDQAMEALERVVDSLRGIAGRKAVLHVSDGIPLWPGAEIADHGYELCNGVGLMQGAPAAMDVAIADTEVDRFNPAMAGLDASRYDTTERWRHLTARANAGNVSLYTFQAGPPAGVGLGEADQPTMTTSPETRARHLANLQGTLFLLAEQTGGRASLHGGDLSSDLAAAVDELRSYYLLAYVAPHPDGTSADLRHIRVEVDREGVDVRHRLAYRQITRDEAIADELTARLLYGGDEAASPLRLRTGPTRSRSGDRFDARFTVEVPLAELSFLDDADLRSALFTVFVAAGSSSGALSEVRQTTVPVRIPAGTPLPPDYSWEVGMTLHRGQDRLAVAVRDEVSGTTRFLIRPIAPPPTP